MHSIVNYPGHPPDSKPLGPAPLTPAMRAGDVLYISGQVGIDPDAATIVGPGFEEQAHQALKNVRSLVENAGFKMSDVIKITVFLTRPDHFPQLNAIYAQYFAEPYPTRSTVAVALQPKSLLIEIEGVAIRSGE
jgi:2-iminobutanoate/2-iminopropanoate deaminase